MGRPKRYASEAEKMKAYRERKKMTAVPVLAEPPRNTETGRDSRTAIEVENGGEARESTSLAAGEADNSRGGSFLPYPEGVPEREWRYACERAERAQRYADMFRRDHIRPSDSRYQMPVWQWENEVRGRFGGIIGGSLSGTRG